MWPFREKPTSYVKLVVLLFSEILLFEPLKFNRNHPEVLKLKIKVHERCILKKKHKILKKKYITLILEVI